MSKAGYDSDDAGEYKSDYIAEQKELVEERKESKDVDDDALIRTVEEYFYGDEELTATFENFVQDNCYVIDLDSEECKLEYTALYEQYKNLFEDKIEGFIERKGYSIVQFYEALKRKTDANPNCNEAIFGQILYSVCDFSIFLVMMREGAQSAANSAKK